MLRARDLRMLCGPLAWSVSVVICMKPVSIVRGHQAEIYKHVGRKTLYKWLDRRIHFKDMRMICRMYSTNKRLKFECVCGHTTLV